MFGCINLSVSAAPVLPLGKLGSCLGRRAKVSAKMTKEECKTYQRRAKKTGQREVQIYLINEEVFKEEKGIIFVGKISCGN